MNLLNQRIKIFNQMPNNKSKEDLVREQCRNLDDLFEVTQTNYENLHDHLGITKTMLTQVKNNPRKATMKLVEEISHLTKVSIQFLVNHFQLGWDNITLTEMYELN